MQQTPLFEQALQAARTFSIEHDINYMSSHLICCAVIEHSTGEDSILDEADKAIFLQKLFAVVMAQPKLAGQAQEEIPYSQEARTMMVLALHYQHAFEDENLDICHYLLAILSCNTRATELLKERGWVFRNYLEWLSQKRGVEVEFPDQLYPATDYIPRRHKIGFLDSMFSRKTKEAIGKQYIEDSLQLWEYKDFDRAFQAIELAKDAPHDDTYYRVKAAIEVRTKRYKAALKTIDEALQKGIAAENLFIHQAHCLCETGAYDQCIAVCQAQLGTTGRGAEAHNMIGFALARQDRHQEAVAHYDAAVQLLPGYAAAMTNKGFSLFRLGFTDDGIAMIHASLQIDKGSSYAYRNLSIIANHIGETDLAAALRGKAFLYGYREDFGTDLDKLQLGVDNVAMAD